jgi:hypothetical protein
LLIALDIDKNATHQAVRKRICNYIANNMEALCQRFYGNRKERKAFDKGEDYLGREDYVKDLRKQNTYADSMAMLISRLVYEKELIITIVHINASTRRLEPYSEHVKLSPYHGRIVRKHGFIYWNSNNHFTAFSPSFYQNYVLCNKELFKDVLTIN